MGIAWSAIFDFAPIWRRAAFDRIFFYLLTFNIAQIQQKSMSISLQEMTWYRTFFLFLTTAVIKSWLKSNGYGNALLNILTIVLQLSYTMILSIHNAQNVTGMKKMYLDFTATKYLRDDRSRRHLTSKAIRVATLIRTEWFDRGKTVHSTFESRLVRKTQKMWGKEKERAHENYKIGAERLRGFP